jgi:phosphoglucosamine mutase
VPTVQDAIRWAESRLGQRGRVVLRASGTEPVIRVMIEAEEEPMARAVAEELATVVRAAAD